jgi:hypothetical protein
VWIQHLFCDHNHSISIFVDYDKEMLNLKITVNVENIFNLFTLPRFFPFSFLPTSFLYVFLFFVLFVYFFFLFFVLIHTLYFLHYLFFSFLSSFLSVLIPVL